MKVSTTNVAKAKRVLQGVLIALFWLSLWQIASLWVSQEILVVSPVKAFMRLLQLSSSGVFWRSVFFTCSRVLSGFLQALVLGGFLAVLAIKIPAIYRLFAPLLRCVSTTPVASFIILALVWIPKNRLSEFIVCLMVTPVVWTNLYTGFSQLDKQLLEVAQVFQFSFWKRLRYVYIPQVMPFFVAACGTGLSFAWKSGIAAEVIALPSNSIGTRIYEAKIYLETPDLFAWTIAVVLLSLFLEKGLMVLLGWLGRRTLHVRL